MVGRGHWVPGWLWSLWDNDTNIPALTEGANRKGFCRWRVGFKVTKTRTGGELVVLPVNCL